MKKLLCILLVAVALFGVTGCGGKETKKEPTKVALTNENFEEYFILNPQLSNFNQNKTNSILGASYDASVELKVKVSPKKKITTDNVTVKAFVNISGFKFYSQQFTIMLDANGEGEYNKLMTASALANIDAPHIGTYFSDDVKEGQILTSDKRFIIYEVSGNVIEE